MGSEVSMKLAFEVRSACAFLLWILVFIFFFLLLLLVFIK